MRKLILAGATAIMAFIAALPSRAQPSTENLIVRVTGVKGRTGRIEAGLFANRAAFPWHPGKAAFTAVGEPNSSEVVLHFSGVRPGVYALAIWHDANANGRVERNMLGMPTEAVGFGNNASAILGPPSFISASVTVLGNSQTIIVKLTY
jgi:uncharacterized protein (DUF2141 family)